MNDETAYAATRKRTRPRILIRNISTLFRDADRAEHGVDVLIDGTRILSVGKDLLEPDLGPSDDLLIIDGRDRLVIPGFVNSHTHLYQSMLKGRRDDLSLVDWCNDVTFPFVRRVLHAAWNDGSTEIASLWSLLGCIEMLRSGVTCFVDMDMNVDGVIDAWHQIGMRGVAAMSLVDTWVPEEIRVSPEQTRDDTLALIERWHEAPGDAPLSTVMLAPSTPFTCTDEMLTWISEQAQAYGLRVTTHVSETIWEVEQALGETGVTPLARLEALGVLENPVLAVHGVHLTEDDIRLAARRNVAVAYNPKSNMKLGSGIAPIVDLHRAGIPITLGTDGAASNDLLDPFEEMRCGLLLQKVAKQDPTVLSARDIFRFATEIGARECGVDAGVVHPGKLADLVVLDAAAAHQFQFSNKIDDLFASLVYCTKASDVITTIVNGRLIMQDRELLGIDEPLILHEIKKVGARYA